MMDIFLIICWAVAGLLVLFSKERPTKLEYGLCWVVLMIQLIDNFGK